MAADLVSCYDFVVYPNYIMLCPTKGRSKERAADAVIAARIKLGHITHMTSDPGSDFTSHLLDEVNSILGIKHRLGLVDRPQGTGIERDVAEVKRFLRSLTAHTDMQHDWSTPRILGVAMLKEEKVKFLAMMTQLRNETVT